MCILLEPAWIALVAWHPSLPPSFLHDPCPTCSEPKKPELVGAVPLPIEPSGHPHIIDRETEAQGAGPEAEGFWFPVKGSAECYFHGQLRVGRR